MKKRFPSFFSGVLATLLVCSLTVSALAISGHMTIEIDPINIQVNGSVFQPKDASGNDVPVFVYNGTTYAPLRALAEAYGLEVGYDADKKIATVTDPSVKAAEEETLDFDYSDWSAEEENAYQEFKAMWDVELTGNYVETDFQAYNNKPMVERANLTYNGKADVDSVREALESAIENRACMNRLSEELVAHNDSNAIICFSYPAELLAYHNSEEQSLFSDKVDLKDVQLGLKIFDNRMK